VNDLESRIRDALQEDASRAPLVSRMPEQVRPRVRRRQAATTVIASVAAIAVIAGSGFALSGMDRDATTPASVPSTATSFPTPGATTAPLPAFREPVAIEPGTYRISSSAWSVADFTVTFPEGWAVQHGHNYLKLPDEEIFFRAVVVDEIYADACEGDSGELMEVGPSVDDLATALLQQSGTMASGPVDTMLGGYPAIRIDLTIPEGSDLAACRRGTVGLDALQIWRSRPADDYFVLLPDHTANAYIVDVDGQRQVFATQYRSSTSEEDIRELQAVLDSIRIEA
jgi:hypothetical protein